MSSTINAQMLELADKIGVLANGINDGETTDDDYLAALQAAIELSESALMNMTDIAQSAERYAAAAVTCIEALREATIKRVGPTPADPSRYAWCAVCGLLLEREGDTPSQLGHHPTCAVGAALAAWDSGKATS